MLILHVSLFDSWLHIIKTLVQAIGTGVIKVGCKSIYCQQTEKTFAMIGAVLRMPKCVALGCLVLIGGLTSLVKKLVHASYSLCVMLHEMRPLTIGKVVFLFKQEICFEQGLTNKTSRASYRLISI